MNTLDDQDDVEEKPSSGEASDERVRRAFVDRLAATSDAPAVATLMLTMSTAALA